ncbi:CRE_HP_G0150920.mRNA.1.CDS.1 [Saccharomyces cerevisiae]|nr:CRE_HP_G0088630.mRNA.1.CDS.1 [Saccharomyces cerevisiae]CAI5174549.1 CRE_HP_G0150920.mRNA.1.CDS.1 [Saccharomyces cerevisiae]CAI6933524.1 CRE_HP_G0088630.mRNA.1.CDS.1 [Saccharomyces cerevisiae]CAI6998245.1 CRE_HP_G0150920.mRNA.1.CDS.1 [Saccharomyces cerevisiae]
MSEVGIQNHKKAVTKPRRREKVIELIEVDGKKVSTTSTGKRKFHNKSKNGCDNCKRRRVKCDEGKPACRKCTNMKLECQYTPIHLRKGRGATVVKYVTRKADGSVEPDSSVDLPPSIKKEQTPFNDVQSAVKASGSSNDSFPSSASTTKSESEEKSSAPIEDKNNMTPLSMGLQGTINKKDMMNNFFSQNGTIGFGSPERLNSGIDGLLLPPLPSGNMGAFQLQQQQQVQQQSQPQTQAQQASGTPNERYGSFDLAGSPALQSTGMSLSNSLSGMLLCNRIPSGQNYTQQQLQYQLHQQLQLQQHQQVQLQQYQQLRQEQHQQVQQQQQEQLQQYQQHFLQQQQQVLLQQEQQPNDEEGGVQEENSKKVKEGPLQSQTSETTLNSDAATLQADALSQLSKMGLSLKSLSTFPTAGIGGVSYDFQELLGIKFPINNGNSRATKASNAEEALANMQEHHERAAASVKENDGQLSDTKSPAPSNNAQGGSASIMEPQAADAVSTMAPISMIERNMNRNSNISPSMPSAVLNDRQEMQDSISSLGNLAKAALENNEPTISLQTSQTENEDDASRQDITSKINNEADRSSVSAGTSNIAKLLDLSTKGNLNLIDMKLFHHYCTKVWPTITAAKVSGPEIWRDYIPELAFDYPFLMHALLAFSATHLSRTETGLEQYVSSHRLDALRLLREAVLEISENNTDALVASALILIMDSLANASGNGTVGNQSLNSMSPSAWIFHVKGAATILTAVWPLSERSKFHNIISVDLSDLGDVINPDVGTITELVCFDESIADLYPVGLDSPYLITLAYLDKLHREKNRGDFILRVFTFPALLDKTFLALLMTGDLGAMRIMRSYYKLLRGFATEVKDKVWFLEGVTQVLPQDVDEYSGGGGMHMMLDFLGGGLPSMTTTNFSDFSF